MTAEDLVRVARKYLELGVQERPRGSNSGPYIDDWLKAQGLEPYSQMMTSGVLIERGYPWCSAAACAWVKEGNGGSYPAGFHPSASGLRLLEKNVALLLPRPWKPQPGDIVVWSHGLGRSHVGVVEGTATVEGVTWFNQISGNTNDDGSRAGWKVWRNRDPLDDVRIAGFIRAWSEK